MAPDPETALLRYRDLSDEQAFASFVASRTDLVWSVALRKLEGDRTLAEEVVQTVFSDVVRKIRHLDLQQPLTSWLVRHTLLKAAELGRRERRRLARDHRYSVMNPPETSAPPEDTYPEAAAVVDSLLGSLPSADRQALLLRFYEKQDLSEVARRMDCSPEAARKRIGRALEVVRAKLAGRGITSSASLLTSALLAGTVQAAPAGLATRAASFGLAHGMAPLGFVLSAKLAALHALRESRWLPALAGGAVVALSTPLWHHPEPTATANQALPAPADLADVRETGKTPAAGAPRRPSARPGTRPAPATVFAELSRLLESPLGTMATDHTRREFVGRWREFLTLSEAEESSLDAWLASSLQNAVGDSRQILNDPALMRLALDQAAGKPTEITPADAARLQNIITALPSLQPRTPWTAENLDPARRERLLVRQQELRTAAAEAAASKAIADLDRIVPLRDDQKNAVFQFHQALALSQAHLLEEERIGFLAAPATLPAPPLTDEESFLASVLDPAQQETRNRAKARQAEENQQTLEGLRRER